MTPWGSPVERERRSRIHLAIAAYAYEMRDAPIMTDAEFDEMAASINPMRETGHPALDTFFRKSFDPSTGMWIHQHPELDNVAETYRNFYEGGQ